MKYIAHHLLNILEVLVAIAMIGAFWPVTLIEYLYIRAGRRYGIGVCEGLVAVMLNIGWLAFVVGWLCGL